ncbi:hypothetical protein HDU76_008437 [Blyttiomyces sp. JEL0837]|nr:hypothetical protein HDU76_008437 [Blyttiomyces sp. JEL0837]
MDLNQHSDKTQIFLDSIDTFLLDCDGVIWNGDHVLPNVREVLAKLRKLGKKLLFVTNNSTKSRKSYLKKFQSLEIEASVDEIFGSAYAAAYYIKNTLQFPQDKKVYICGMSGIQEELDSEGIRHCGAGSDNENLKSLSEISLIKPDPEIGAVLFGLDLDINYKKLAKAFTYLNSNENCTGALLAALAAPIQRKPTVLGKPEQSMLDVIVAKYHLNRERCCMVGDRCDISRGEHFLVYKI